LRTPPTAGEIGKAVRIDDAWAYIEFVKLVSARHELEKRVVVDCAHGAAYNPRPALLHELGAEGCLWQQAPTA